MGTIKRKELKSKGHFCFLILMNITLLNKEINSRTFFTVNGMRTLSSELLDVVKLSVDLQ